MADKMLHVNQNYKVVLVDEAERKVHQTIDGGHVTGNFKVVNNTFDTCEQWCESYPAALGVCEYFNSQLETQSYLNVFESSHSPSLVTGSSELEEWLEEAGIPINDIDEDDGGQLQ